MSGFFFVFSLLCGASQNGEAVVCTTTRILALVQEAGSANPAGILRRLLPDSRKSISKGNIPVGRCAAAPETGKPDDSPSRAGIAPERAIAPALRYSAARPIRAPALA